MTLPSTIRPTFLLFLAILLTGCQHAGASSYVYPRNSSPTVDNVLPTQRPYVVNNRVYYPIPSSYGYHERGIASWYGQDFHGRPTACGETYDMYAMTSAHKTLPMNTMILVKNLQNGRQTVVRINDRGPFAKNRVIDLSYRAARELGIVQDGTAMVELTALATKLPDPGNRQELEQYDFNRGKFYVQVASCKIRENARSLARHFAAQRRDVVIQQYNKGEETFFRVLVYGGQYLNNAKLLESQLEKNGFPDSFVVAR